MKWLVKRNTLLDVVEADLCRFHGDAVAFYNHQGPYDPEPVLVRAYNGRDWLIVEPKKDQE